MKPCTSPRNAKPPLVRLSTLKLKDALSPPCWNKSNELTGCGKINTMEKFPGIISASATPKDIADCISCWLAYLQMLNGLCSAGSRLSACLCGLSQENHMMASHCQAMWEELVRASTVASSNIKTNVLTALQELSLVDTQADRPRSNETNQAISNSLAAFIHLQYQLCAACCECLGPVLGCPCPPDRHEPECNTEAMHRCFQRLFPPPARSPLPPALAPFTGCQRRWSEAAAQDVSSASADSDGTMRRWSMPWESNKVSDQQAAWPGSRLMPKHKLTVPTDRSRSTTPESALHSSMASQEELQEVIQLLSCPVQTATKPGKSNLPGVVLTGCGFDSCHGDNWSEANTPGSRRGSTSPHRGQIWPVQGWSDGEVQTPSGGDGNYELSAAMLDPGASAGAVASRKSSSSTDSSSSYSLHSRSTTGSISAGSTSDGAGAQEARTQLYSMWSGADLPFIKLPESNEVIEETPTDVNQSFFAPHPI